jgi:hypothetical protein
MADWPYEAKVWRLALLAAAHEAVEAISKPPARRPKEPLKVFVNRAQAPLLDAMQRWERANEEMHSALARVGKAP